jgi:hypothetical protein
MKYRLVRSNLSVSVLYKTNWHLTMTNTILSMSVL